MATGVRRLTGASGLLALKPFSVSSCVLLSSSAWPPSTCTELDDHHRRTTAAAGMSARAGACANGAETIGKQKMLDKPSDIFSIPPTLRTGTTIGSDGDIPLRLDIISNDKHG